jgi:uncharacterized protein YukE
MAKIMNVDYEAIPAQAKSMRTNGQSLNTELTKAYKSISDMHSNWYGKRYNELVKSFNSIIPQINELLELVVGDIPYALETVANNYSQADKGSNVTSATKTSPKKITNLSTPNDVGMKFITTSVESTQKSVSTNFKNAKDKMNTIESAFNKIKWQSEASDAFKTKFKKLKSDIVTAFEDIDTQFKKLMTQALNDVQSAEKSNTVS